MVRTVNVPYTQSNLQLIQQIFIEPLPVAGPGPGRGCYDLVLLIILPQYICLFTNSFYKYLRHSQFTRVTRHLESIRQLQSGRGDGRWGQWALNVVPVRSSVKARSWGGQTPEGPEMGVGGDTREKVQEGPTDMLLSSKQCCPVLDLWIKISFVPSCR